MITDTRTKVIISFFVFYAILILKVKNYYQANNDDSLDDKLQANNESLVKKNLTCYQCFTNPEYKISFCDSQHWKLTSEKVISRVYLMASKKY